MKKYFSCSKCRKKSLIGKLRAKYTCPFCKNQVLVTKEDKQRGYKVFKRTNTY